MSERQEFTEDMNGFSDDDRHLERLLASLKPRESRINRDRVMFLAGQASAVVSQRSRSLRLARWIWPAVTVCSTCAGLLMGAALTADHRIAGNPVAGAPPPLRERVAAETSRRTTTAQNQNAQRDRKTVAAKGLAAEQPADSRDEQVDGEFDGLTGNPFTLLALRERMLAGRWDDLALAQVDSSPVRGGSATGPERSLGARELLRRWIAEEGPKQR
jgi:hypothetical protein